MVQKHRFWASPRRGTHGRTHARTHGGIISFELSPLERCMRVNSNKERPRLTESDWEWVQSQEERGERGMWDRKDRVRWESEKCMVLDGRYWYLTILRMILAGRYWNSRFQRLILWCVLSIWRKPCQFYIVFWRRRGAKYCKIHKWLSEISDGMVQKHMFWASPRRGTHGRTHARTDE